MTDTQSAYLEVIADLKRRRDQIDQLISTIGALVGEELEVQSDADMPLRGMKVLDAAKAVLRENGQPMSPAAITERIQAEGCEVSSANTVASILHRYAKDNDDVFSPERGLWGIRLDAVQTEPMAAPSGFDALARDLSSAGVTGIWPLTQASVDSAVVPNLPGLSSVGDYIIGPPKE